MGTILIAGSYGVGKSTLCAALSMASLIPTFSAGDLISNVNGEQYGANKVVKNKEENQDILAVEVNRILAHYDTILLAGHFCIFDKYDNVVKLPYSVFERISLQQILLLEANPEQIIINLNNRDKKVYEKSDIIKMIMEERHAAEEVAQKLECPLHIHHMTFDKSDLQDCCSLLNIGGECK